MPWFAKVEGKELSFDDLPMSAWAGIERALRSAGVDKSWVDVYTNPAKHAAAAVEILRSAAREMGLTPPDDLKPRELLDAFRWEKEDDLPDTWEDGAPSPGAAPTTG